MPFSRRRFLSGAAASLAFSGLAGRSAAQAKGETYRNEVPGYGPLVKDPNGIFDLPEGFRYDVVSQAGERMSDGLLVPYKADGMGCFAHGPDQVVLVRNHELKHTDVNYGPFGLKKRLYDGFDPAAVYDTTEDGVPMPGGTTTLVWDLKARRLVSQNLSLLGTTVNCAGGITPRGTWLTCEEKLLSAGQGGKKDHGWVFEVPAVPGRLAAPEPIRGMGRFMHEAAAVDPKTGIVYLTEDQHDGACLFYRYLPNDRADLHKGGKLQALGFRDAPEGGDSRNWKGNVAWTVGDWKKARWIDLDGVDNPHEDLRHRGHKAGAALFARGEGIFFGNGELYFTCTSGGAAGLGQIMRYVPSPREGRPGERLQPGRIQLFVESHDRAVMDFADNITLAPWGHLLACEDQYSDRPVNHLKGITPEGKVYTIGRNAFRDAAELAGACFSPDGSTLFLNIYWPGITLAVTGPWNRFQG
ncbi:MAG TPA: alkaline phosphatase PhoX [Caulobacteraceae bacterium]|nr:alkaline phosphatase PhoX [Caulobacteraceae bacterium]